MEGEVSPFLELVIPIELLTESGGTVSVNTVIDTGFSDYLLLPSSIILGCGFYYFDDLDVTLADGDEVILGVYVGTIKWFGENRRVSVLSAESVPLIGMKQLKGCRVGFEVVDGGLVTIAKI
jgi:clan AA aspartic protease